jgi:hypothetical protein
MSSPAVDYSDECMNDSFGSAVLVAPPSAQPPRATSIPEELSFPDQSQAPPASTATEEAPLFKAATPAPVPKKKTRASVPEGQLITRKGAISTGRVSLGNASSSQAGKEIKLEALKSLEQECKLFFCHLLAQ